MRPVDPYEEFYKVELFDAEDSVPFAAGRIDGYFDGEIPPAFWQVQKVYVAYTILYSLLWAVPFGQGEVDGMRARYERSMRAYDNFEREIRAGTRTTKRGRAAPASGRCRTFPRPAERTGRG